MNSNKLSKIFIFLMISLIINTAFINYSPANSSKVKNNKTPKSVTNMPVKTPTILSNKPANIVKPKALKTINVKIFNFSFTPQNITINKGDTVIWTNFDAMGHTVTGKNFDSGNLNTKGVFKFTFNTQGTFNYVCTYHPSMTGVVIVK